MHIWAAVLTEFGRPLGIRRIEIDDPGPGEVRVRIRACGVCGSDAKAHAGLNPLYREPPVVLGHESLGVVEKIGEGVTSVRPGDHVLIGMNRLCGRCVECVSGRAHLCTGAERQLAIAGRMADGGTRIHLDGGSALPFIGIGGFAEYTVVGESMLVTVPEELVQDALALLACGGITGVGAVRNVAGVRSGETVLVVGCGGVGLNVVQGAVLAGAARVIAIDKEPGKLATASRLGATDVLPAADDLTAQVLALVPAGVDHAFDVTGAPGVASAAMAATRPGGTTVMVGSPAPGSRIEIAPHLLFGDRVLRGCVGGNAAPAADLPLLVDLVGRGRLLLEPLISERIPLDQVNEGLDGQRAGEVTRSLIVFAE